MNKISKYSIYFIIGLLWYLFLSLSLQIDYASTFRIPKSTYNILLICISLVIVLWASFNMYKEYKTKQLHPLFIGSLMIAGGVTGLIIGQLIINIY